jgi:hypothetical protein
MDKKPAALVVLLMIACLCVAGCALPVSPGQNTTSSAQPKSSAVERPPTATPPGLEHVLLFADSTDTDSAQMVATTAKLPWHVEVHYIDQEPYWANVARFMYSVNQTPTLTVVLYERPFEHTAFKNIVGVHSADEIVTEVNAILDC